MAVDPATGATWMPPKLRPAWLPPRGKVNYWLGLVLVLFVLDVAYTCLIVQQGHPPDLGWQLACRAVLGA